MHINAETFAKRLAKEANEFIANIFEHQFIGAVAYYSDFTPMGVMVRLSGAPEKFGHGYPFSFDASVHKIMVEVNDKNKNTKDFSIVNNKKLSYVVAFKPFETFSFTEKEYEMALNEFKDIISERITQRVAYTPKI